jgi:hypothetical protein
MKIGNLNIGILLIATFIFIFFATKIATHPISDNDASRLAGILSVAQNNMLPIEQTPYNKIGDRIVYQDISYSSKPPVLHVVTGLTLKVLFTIKPALLYNNVAIYRVSTALINTIPLVLIYICFYYLLKNALQLKTAKSHLFSLFLIFGTLLFTYTKYLTNHIIESLFQLALFYLLVKFKPTKLNFTLIGIFLSAIFVIDVTNGVIVVPATLLWLFYYHKIKLKDILWIFLGAVPLLITHFYLSYVQFNNFLPPQLFPETYLSYPGSKWIGELQGFEALNQPISMRFFNYTFGTHGLFLYQPLLLVPFFFKKNWKDPLWLYTFAIVLGYVLFNTIMQKNYAGSAFGPRRFLPLIPIIYFFVVKNLSEYWTTFKIEIKAIIIFAFAITAIISYVGYKNPWTNYSVKIDSHEVYFPILYTLENSKKLQGF